MVDVLLAWPTVVTIDRVALTDRVNENLVAAALLVEERTRIAGDSRHFASAVDNHADVFPGQFRADLGALWTAVQAAIRSYLSQNYGLDTLYRLTWSLSVLVAREGDRVPAHAHPQRDLFAVYYPHVDTPKQAPTGMNGGELRFIDTRGWGRKWTNRNPVLFDKAYLSIPPARGTLVIAPSYALHETNGFSGVGLRVTYGFFINLDMTREYAA